MIIFPHRIETLEQVKPWSNWLLILACSLFSCGVLCDYITDESLIDSLILTDMMPGSVFGHVLLHADYLHLIGNMIFLWVFGNAICANTNNLIYPLIFLVCTLLAASVHIILDGSPVIGASGAINGLVGLTLAMYPVNRVSIFYLVFFVGGTFKVRAWIVILAWIAFDVIGLFVDGDGIAYWAHIGGFVGGLLLGLIALQFRWIQITTYDNRSLLEILKGEHPDLS